MNSLPIHLSRVPVAVILPSVLPAWFLSFFRLEVSALHKDLAKALAHVGSKQTYAAAVDSALSAFVRCLSLSFTDLCAGRIPDTCVSGSKHDLSAFHARLFEALQPLFGVFEASGFATGFKNASKAGGLLREGAPSAGPTFVSFFFSELAALFAEAFALFLGAASFGALRVELQFSSETSLRQPLVFGNSLNSGIDALLGFRDSVAYWRFFSPDDLALKATTDKLAGDIPTIAAALRLGALPAAVVVALEHTYNQKLLLASLTTTEAELAVNRVAQWTAIAGLFTGPRQPFVEVWSRLLQGIAPVLARLPKVSQLSTAPPVSSGPSATPSTCPPTLCHRCGVSGHRTPTCTAAVATYAATGPCSDRRCKGDKHWNVDCPHRRL
jgi:hypothetical protein